MEAVDTVLYAKCHCMRYHKTCSCICDDCNRVKIANREREDQASTSFEAGVREGARRITQSILRKDLKNSKEMLEYLKDHRRAGVMMVAKWVEENCLLAVPGGITRDHMASVVAVMIGKAHEDPRWRAQLKEWLD